MQDYELDDYLGDTEATDEQRAAIMAAADTIEARYPIPADGTPEDVADDREAALAAAVQVILGDNDPAHIVGQWQAAQRQQVERHAAMTGALIASDLSDSEASRVYGLTRMTVRKARGK